MPLRAACIGTVRKCRRHFLIIGSKKNCVRIVYQWFIIFFVDLKNITPLRNDGSRKWKKAPSSFRKIIDFFLFFKKIIEV